MNLSTEFIDLLENLPYKAFVKNCNFQYTHCNKMYASLLGKSINDIINKADSELMPSQISSNLNLLEKEVLSGKIIEDKILFELHGLSQWLYRKLFPLKNAEGKIIGLSGIYWDVSDEKDYDASPLEKKEKLKPSFEQKVFGFFHSSLQGKFLKVNEKFCEMTGYSESELLNLTFMDITHPEDLNRDLGNLKNFLDGIINMLSFEKRYIKKDKSVVWIHLTISGILNPFTGNLIQFYGIAEDITKKKFIEKENKENKILFESVFSSMQDGFVIITPGGYHHRVNPAFEKMVGFSEEELIGVGIPYPYWIPGEIEDVKRKYLNIIDNHDFSDIELDLQKKTGERITVSISPSNIKNEKGEISFIFAILKDITYLKKSENELKLYKEELEKLVDVRTSQLKESEEKQRAQYLAIPVPTYTWQRENNHFILVDFNEAAERITNGKVKDLLYIKSFEYYNDREEILAHMERTYLTRQNEETDMWYTLKTTGEEKYFTVKYAFVPPNYVMIHTDDITQKKKIELELLRSEEKFKNIFDNMQDGYLKFDINGNVIHSNRSLHEMLGNSLIDFNIKDVLDNPLEGNQIIEILKKQGKLIGYRTVLRKNNNEKIIVESNFRLIKDKYDNPIEIEAISRDITSRIKIEEDLKIEKENLNNALRDAEQAAIAKSEFLANMSHEIRTPMNAIMGLSYLILKTQLTSFQVDYINKILGATESLLGIINDILDFSKMEAGKLELESTLFNLEDVLKNISQIMSIRAKEKGLDFIIDIKSKLPNSLIGDPTRLGQILLNLITNAVKFTDKGEINLSVEEVEKNENKIILNFSVKDSGIGMSDVQKSKLFQPFTQADSSTTRKYGGAGLGLIISKQLVDLMNGQIKVESEENRGSNFSFTCEFYISSENALNPVNQIKSARGLKILIVDDNKSTRDYLFSNLASMNFEIKSLDSGWAAIIEVEKADRNDNPFQVLIIDWKMQGLDGIETATAIKKNEKLKKIPKIILITAYGKEAINNSENIVDVILSKPINISKLTNEIFLLINQNSNLQSNHEERSLTGQNLLFKNTKVLLVEDNSINRQIATEILKGIGINVDIAFNGKEAIDKIIKKNIQYDLIIMDLQMPIMDGYEATKFIRKFKTKEELPIIALTAHALIEERNRCLAIGMNDHISKPFMPSKFISTLGEWLGMKIEAEDFIKNQENMINIEDNYTPIKSQVNIKDALNRLGGDEELLVEILKNFQVDFKGSIDILKDYYIKSDFSSMQFLVHSIKGASGNIAANKIYESSKNLEMVIRERKLEAIPGLLRELEMNLVNLLNGITKLEYKAKIENNNNTNISKESIDMIRDLIKELDLLLSKNNMSAKKVFSNLSSILSNSLYSEDISKIEQFMSKLNFKEARKLINDLAQKISLD